MGAGPSSVRNVFDPMGLRQGEISHMCQSVAHTLQASVRKIWGPDYMCSVLMLTGVTICDNLSLTVIAQQPVDLSRLIWTPLKLVLPGMNFSEIFGPTLKSLFPLYASHMKENH